MVSNQDSLPPLIFSAHRITSESTRIHSHGVDELKGRSGKDEWAASLRNQIDHTIISIGRPHHDDSNRLHKKLVKLMVAVLQPNSSKQAWHALVTGLRLAEPYAQFLNSSPGQALQNRHYVQRLRIAYSKCIIDLADIPLLEALEKIFPHEFLEITSDFGNETVLVKRQVGMHPDVKIVKAQLAHKNSGLHNGSLNFVLPDGSFPYILHKSDEEDFEFFKEKQLTFGDLRESFAAFPDGGAALEMVSKELKSVAAPAPEKQPIKLISSSFPRGKLQQISGGEISGHKSIPPIPIAPFESVTGREAVEILTMKRHLNHVQFMYFNHTESRHYRPYDLVSVPEDKVNPEHYVFSTFGVLHVFPDGSTSETMSLDEWNRMAVLWMAISNLGFFKNFLLCKSLSHWKKVVRRQRLMRIRNFLQNNLVLAVPQFGWALSQIIHLLQQLTEMRMLPDENLKIREFPLTAFSSVISKKTFETDKLLDLFFHFCNKIIEKTRRDCFDQLKHFEYQAQQHKPLFSKESLFIQRRKNRICALNLEKARHAVQQLSTFLSLVDKIISIHLLQLVRLSAYGFVHGVLCMKYTDDDTKSISKSQTHVSMYSAKTSNFGNSSSHASDTTQIKKFVFATKFVFNSKTCLLEMQPSVEKFKSTICCCIDDVMSAVSEKAATSNKTGIGNGDDKDEDMNEHLGRTGSNLPSSRSSVSQSSSFDVGDENNFEDEKMENDGFGTDLEPGCSLPSDEGVPGDYDRDVTSPVLVQSSAGEKFGLSVAGTQVKGEFQRSDHSDLRVKMATDIEIVEALKTQNDVVNSALMEVEIFCEECNKWLVPIKMFTMSWSAERLKEMKGKPARDIETLLNQIKTWIEKVKNMDRFLLSSNNLIYGDCRGPQSDTVSTLSAIFKQLLSLVTDDAKSLSTEVMTKSKAAIKLLENKELTIKSFAAYARKVTECNAMRSDISGKVQYIRELYEVVRMTHRQLNHDEEKVEEKVKSAWEAFVFQLKDAANFVTNQQPIILKQLHEVFDEKRAYILKLNHQTSSGATVDPTKSPSEVISELRNLIMKFSATKRQLTELSNCRESIEGISFELDDLPGMSQVMDNRLELWKYVNLSSQTIHEWNGMLFRRFNVRGAIDKVTEWERVSKKLQILLSETDPVLTNWTKTLSIYLTDLPLLEMMSNQAVKIRHWKLIFTGLGRCYEPGWNFTVKDLLSFNVSEHAKFINQICHGALAEFKLEQMLKFIKDKWEDKQFQLSKHIQILRVKVKQEATKPKTETKTLKRSLRPAHARHQLAKPSKFVLQEIDSETYTVVGMKELLSELSDSHTMLQSMLQSRHAAEIRSEAELWSDTFQQIQEIVQLWGSCQDKWMYLNMVFHNDSILTTSHPEQTLLFEDMDKRYREFVKAVVNDPKVLSVLSRRHGQKGWRELQGENLRKHIVSCIRMQEELQFTISYLLDEFRSSFSRMHFLCDEDCVRLLAINRQPRAFTPYVKKCFLGIKSINYVMSSSLLGIGSFEENLDQELHAHRLEVTHIEGKNGEMVKFKTPLPMQSDAITWMKMFETKLSQSLKHSLIELMHLHKHGSLNDFSNVTQPQGSELGDDTRHWLLRFPTQIVLLYESIQWTNIVEDVLNQNVKNQWKELCSKLDERISQCSHLLRNCGRICGNQDYNIFHHTLVKFIAQKVQQRNTLCQFDKNEVTSFDSFEWQKIIKHSLRIPKRLFDFNYEFESEKFPDCLIEHLGIPVDRYGMEYESNDLENSTMPFAMMSTSERSAFAFCVALRMGKCGTLLAPSSSGKTALIQHLASVFGRRLVNLNCTEELNLKTLTRALCGAIESPFWLCLDHVQHLPQNMLSILGQHVHDIQLACSALFTSNVSKYKVGQKQVGKPILQRSESYPSLHSSEVNPNSKEWVPDVNWEILTQWNSNKDDAPITINGMPHRSFEKIGSITFNGKLLQVDSKCGLFMTLNYERGFDAALPENLKLAYRSISFISPDVNKLAEVWLTSHGFLNSIMLARKVSLVFSAVERIGDSMKFFPTSEDNESLNVAVNSDDLRAIVSIASSVYQSRISQRNNLCASDEVTESKSREALMNLHIEEECLSGAILDVLKEKFVSNESMKSVEETLQKIFSRQNSVHNDILSLKLEETVRMQLQINGYHSSPLLVKKIMELNSSMGQGNAVMIAGPPGSGKTTLYRTLAGALNQYSMENSTLLQKLDSDIPQTDDRSVKKAQSIENTSGLSKTVDVSVVYPNVLTSEDLFGHYLNTSSSEVWIPGLMSKTLWDFASSQNDVSGSNGSKKWIVLDGEINSSWIENINCLISGQHITRLQNLDEMALRNGMQIVFEVSDLASVSPALISRCRIVNCRDINHWSFRLQSWLDTAYRKYAVTQDVIRVWKELIEDLVPQTLSFLSSLGRNVMTYGMTYEQMMHSTSNYGSYEVNAFLQLLSSLMNIHLDRENQGKTSGKEKQSVDLQPETTQTPISNTSGMSSVQSQLDDEIPDFNYQLAMNIFGFAFVWAFGGQLLEEDMARFDVFFRNLSAESRNKINFPIYENVFEYFVDGESGEYLVWEDKLDLVPHAPNKGIYYSAIHQIERYAYLSSVLLESDYSVLVMGERGCGKTSMVSNLLQHNHKMIRIPISSGMTPWHMQKQIESHLSPHLKQHNIGLMAHPNAVIDTRADTMRNALFFLDDVSCAPKTQNKNNCGPVIQQTHELVRQILSSNTVFDKDRQLMKSLDGNVNFLCTASIAGSLGSGAGYSTHTLSPRLSRQLFTVHFLKPSKDAILSIYHNVVQSWLEEFPAYSLSRHYDLSQAIIAGAVDLYSQMQANFKPTPRNPTYVFSLHDLSHVMQGLFLLKPKSRGRPRPVRRRMQAAVAYDGGPAGPRQRPLAGRAGRRFMTKQVGDTAAGASPMMRTVIRMWLYECSRTFHDRLMHENDRNWFSEHLVEVLKKHFCTGPENRMPMVPTPSGSPPGLSSSEDTLTPMSQFTESTTSKRDDLQESDSPKESAIDESPLVDESPLDVEDKESVLEDVTESSFVDGETSGRNTELQSFSQESSSETANQSVMDDESEYLPETDDVVTESRSLQTAATTVDPETESTSNTAKSDDQLTAESSSSKSDTTVPYDPETRIDSAPEPSGAPVQRQRRPVQGRPGGAKFGVTFMPGLINDPDQGVDHFGPLATLEQVLSENENPASILFGYNILSFGSVGAADICETTEQQISLVLETAQIAYNENNDSNLRLVFFQQAIHHIVRMSRAISMSQYGHALCLSNVHFAGRKSLCKLAAFMCSGAYIHASNDCFKTDDDIKIKEKFRSYISQASMSAALQNKPTVLVVDETFSDITSLENLCSVIKEGQYPSLYSHEELVKIASEISSEAGLVSIDSTHHLGATEKMDLCLDMFFRRVISNLHIVLLLRYPRVHDEKDLLPLPSERTGPYFQHLKQLKFLHEIFMHCPELLTRFACVDFYDAWSHTAWMEVGMSFLGDAKDCKVMVPWSSNVDKQMLNVCHVMSFIHQDCQNRIQDTLSEFGDRLISPTTFRNMIDLFLNIATQVGQFEKVQLERYQSILQQIEASEQDLKRICQGKKALLPILHAAIETERSWKRHVEQERKEYAEAKERCSLEEEIIENLETELQFYQQDARQAFDKVNPLYSAAVQAIQAITVQDLDELKWYKSPPKGAIVVVKVLCDLFEVKPADWENGKSLLLRDNFFDELQYFDKDNIPEHVYQALSKNVYDPEFQPAKVGKGSKAAEALCTWLHAVHSYAKMSRYLAPKIAMLKNAEAKMKKAQSTLGAKRVRCNQIKTGLDMIIQKHKDSYAVVKKHEQELENFETTISEAQTVMGNLAEHISAWRLKHNSVQSRLNSAIADSLLTASCYAYHGVMDKYQRESSLHAWIEICSHGYVDELSGEIKILKQQSILPTSMHTRYHTKGSPSELNDLKSASQLITKEPLLLVQKDFDPRQLMPSNPMHTEWKKLSFSKSRQIESASMFLLGNSVYQKTCWPMIFDPDDQLGDWIKVIAEVCFKYNNRRQKKVSIDDSSLDKEMISKSTDMKIVVCCANNAFLKEKLEECKIFGSIMIVTHLERIQPSDLQHILQQHNREKDVNSNFKLFLSTSIHMKFLDGYDSLKLPLESCCNIDFSLDSEGIKENLVNIIMAHERPEFESHVKMLDADIFHLEEQRDKIQQELMDKVTAISGSVFEDPTLLDAIRICKRETLSADAALNETRLMKSNLLKRVSQLHTVSIQGAAVHQAIMQTSILRKDCYYWTGSKLLTIFADIMDAKMKGKSNSSQSSGLSLKSWATELGQNILEATLQSVRRTMFDDDYLLLTSILSLSILENQKQIPSDIVQNFLLPGVNKLASATTKRTISSVVKPSWMHDNVWRDAKMLEMKHAAYHGLTDSIRLKQSLWHEYLHSPVSLLANVPCDDMLYLNIGQKALLWKTLQPGKTAEIMSELSCGVLGRFSTEHHNCTVESLLKTVKNHVPVVFLTSPEGTAHHPATEIRLQAELNDIQLIEKSAPFTADILSFLRISIKKGYWLLLHECDLEQSWPTELVSIMYSICDQQGSLISKENADENYGDDTTTLSSGFTRSDDSGLESDVSTKIGSLTVENITTEHCYVNENFRLWILMKPNTSYLPEIFLRKSLIVNLTSSFDNARLLKHNKRMVCLIDKLPDRKSNKTKDVLNPSTILVFLHSVIADAGLIENWILASNFTHQVEGVLELCKNLLPWKQYSQRNSYALECMIGKLLDFNGKQSLAQEKFYVFLQAILAKIKSKPIPHSRLCITKYAWNAKNKMQVMIEKTTGFISKHAIDLQRSLFDSHFVLADMESKFEMFILEVGNKVQDLAVPHLDEEITRQDSPIVQFYISEHSRISKLVHIMKRNILACIDAVKRMTEMSSAMLEIFDALLSQMIPSCWIEQHPEIFCLHSNCTIVTLISKLEQLIKFLPTYAEQGMNCFQNGANDMRERPVQYNLAIFLRPDLFLEAVLAQYSMTTPGFVESSFVAEILPKNAVTVTTNTTSSIVVNGICLEGATYDQKAQSIFESSSSVYCKMPAICLTPKTERNDQLVNSQILHCPLWYGEQSEDRISLYIPLKCANASLFHLREVRAITCLEHHAV